jgi:hypothetical protein
LRKRKEHERRGKRRFRVQRELRYKVLDRKVVVGTGSGKTLDISSTGVAFKTKGVLQPGVYVELSISWPAKLDQDCPIRLVVGGPVVRLDNRRAAMKIQTYDFRTQGRAAVAGASRDTAAGPKAGVNRNPLLPAAKTA